MRKVYIKHKSINAVIMCEVRLVIKYSLLKVTKVNIPIEQNVKLKMHKNIQKIGDLWSICTLRVADL